VNDPRPIVVVNASFSSAPGYSAIAVRTYVNDDVTVHYRYANHSDEPIDPRTVRTIKEEISRAIDAAIATVFDPF
jgi:hypothetical protein